jgi:linoleoyl-CoA desaturase
MEMQKTPKFLADFSTIRPSFDQKPEETALFAELRSKVEAEIARWPKLEWQLYFKAILFPLVYFGIYLFALSTGFFWQFVASYALLGWMVVLIFLNLLHETAHDNVFPSKRMNGFYLYFFDLIGANSHLWKLRHVVFHHNFPNVMGWDPDIEKSDFLKVHPKEQQNRKKKNKTWMFFLYPFFLLNWFLFRDFRDFFDRSTIVRKLGPIPFLEYVKLFLFKFAFVGYMVLIPKWLLGYSWGQILLALLVFFIVAGSHGLIVLLPPHVNTHNDFATANPQGKLPYSWFIHQLATTNDVDGRNWYYKFVMGNFNCHIAHHLFPKVSYLYADRLTDIIRDFCKEKNLPYKSLPLRTALKQHFVLIKNNKKPLDIWEEDM